MTIQMSPLNHVLKAPIPTVSNNHTILSMIQSDYAYTRNVVSRVVIYTNLETGKNYTLEAIAYETGELPYKTIQKFCFLNGKLLSAGYRLKHPSDNPLRNMCSSCEKAIMYMLASAETDVFNMTFNDAQDWTKEYNNWLDSLKS